MKDILEKRKILLIKDLVVKFRVRSKVLTSIRNISFDIYEGETVAIVGESGSGKSVLTKTITNMLESNGYISNGSIAYYPSEESKNDKKTFFKEPVDLINFHRGAISGDLIKGIKKTNLNKISELNSKIETLLNSPFEKEMIKWKIDILKKKLSKATFKSDFSRSKKLQNKIIKLKSDLREIEFIWELSEDKEKREFEISKLRQDITESYEEIANFAPLSWIKKQIYKKVFKHIRTRKLEKISNNNIKNALSIIKEEPHKSIFEKNFEEILNQINKNIKIEEEALEFIYEAWIYQKKNSFVKKRISIKKLKKVRGGTIATIFQDPMTSLNPLLSVGYQICEVLKLHHKMSYFQAKKEAIALMEKVGIPNAEKRFKDIPSKYSGGMRQRVVIAVALACRPKILICDEPTTALDVTVQAQVLQLIKDLKEEYKFTVIFITHDLGVVANIADRVAVVYAGQIIEYGLTNEIFFDPQHPYTWALLSSLPQLGVKGEELFAIEGTPPSLFEEIKGDAFAPRNQFALAIDYEIEPPMFKVTDTHFAKTWLLDPRSPKIEKPSALNNIKSAVEEAKVGD